MSVQVKCVGEVAKQGISRNSIYSYGKFRGIEINIEVICKEFYALKGVEETMNIEYGGDSHKR